MWLAPPLVGGPRLMRFQRATAITLLGGVWLAPAQTTGTAPTMAAVLDWADPPALSRLPLALAVSPVSPAPAPSEPGWRIVAAMGRARWVILGEKTECAHLEFNFCVVRAFFFGC